MTRPHRLDRIGFVVLTLLYGCPASLFAQPPATPPPPPQEGSAEFSFVGTGGNSSTQAIGAGGQVTVRRGEWVHNAKLAYVRNETEQALQAQSFAALFQSARAINARVSAYGRYAFLRDTFAGIENRNSVSGGLEYLAVRPEPHQLLVNAGIGYANEQRVAGDDLSTAEFLTGASYKWTISPTADLTDTFDVSVSLSETSDWRTANVAALTARLTTLFSLKLSNIVRYVHEPVEGFETTDTITSIALVAKF
jgi:putative salt-induced outer membrane protein